MTNIKMFIQLLAIFLVNPIFAQTTSITQLFEKTLQQENNIRTMLRLELDSLSNEMDMAQQDLDSLEVTELVVKYDTLYYTTKQKMRYHEGYFLEQQVVALKDITVVSKDIGIFFETKYDKLKIIRNNFYSNNEHEEEVLYKNLFRTYVISLRDIEYLADELVNAFQIAGFHIEKGYWYD